jgi:hypothetical protein
LESASSVAAIPCAATAIETIALIRPITQSAMPLPPSMGTARR